MKFSLKLKALKQKDKLREARKPVFKDTFAHKSKKTYKRVKKVNPEIE